jgi:hypothetical protein
MLSAAQAEKAAANSTPAPGSKTLPQSETHIHQLQLFCQPVAYNEKPGQASEVNLRLEEGGTIGIMFYIITLNARNLHIYGACNPALEGTRTR